MSSQTLDVNQLNPIQQTFQGDTIDALGDAVSAWESYIQDVSTLAGTTIEDLARIQNLYLNSNLHTVIIDGVSHTIDPANPGEVSVAHSLQAVRHLQDFIDDFTNIVEYDWDNPAHAATLTSLGYTRVETTLGVLATERQVGGDGTPVSGSTTVYDQTDNKVLFLELDQSAFASGSQGFAEQRYMLGILSDMGIINPSEEQSIINDGNPQFRVHEDFMWSNRGRASLEFHVMARDMREWHSMNGPEAHRDTTGYNVNSFTNRQDTNRGGSTSVNSFFQALILDEDITTIMTNHFLHDQRMPRSGYINIDSVGLTIYGIEPAAMGAQNTTGWATIGPNNFDISGAQINRVSGAVASRVTEISAGAILTATNKVTISGSLVDAHMQVIKQQANQVKKGAEALK